MRIAPPWASLVSVHIALEVIVGCQCLLLLFQKGYLFADLNGFSCFCFNTKPKNQQETNLELSRLSSDTLLKFNF